MAIPSLYVADIFKTGSPPQVYELVAGTTLNAIGAPLSLNSSESAVTAAEGDVINRIVEYRGQIYICYLSSGSLIIDTYNRGTGLWTNSHTVANQIILVGLFVVNTGTAQRLFMFNRAASAATTFSYTDDGSNWTTTVGAATAPSALGECPPLMFNQKLYYPYFNSGGFVYEFDPLVGNFAQITGGWGGSNAGSFCDLCVYDDRLFALSFDATTTGVADWALYEFLGSGWSLNTQITNDNRGGNTAINSGQCNLFIDPSTNNLIALCHGAGAGGATNYGATAFQLAPSGSVFTPTEITDTVIPVALRPGARGTSTNNASDRWYSITVNDTTATSPEVYIYFAQGPAPGTSYAIYTWTDASTLLASPAAGPSTTFTIPQEKTGGGLRINRSTNNQCAIQSGVPIIGGFRISYRVYGTMSSQNVTGYYSLAQETPTTQMSISAQTGGSGITGGNTVTGITGDDGATLFTLDWNTVSDGVLAGDIVNIMLDINP